MFKVVSLIIYTILHSLFPLVKRLSIPGVPKLFRLTEPFGPKKTPRNSIKKNPSEVVCFYLKKND